MKAIKIFEHGNTDVLKYVDTDIPEISSNEVLIKIKACALNHLDIWARKGIKGVPIPLPLIPGSDISGIVSKIGPEVKNVKKGQRVIVAPGISDGTSQECLEGNDHLCNSYKILGYMCNGGYAEYINVPKSNILPLPDHLSFEEGAAIPLVFMTAWHMLVGRAKIKPGETVLIQAAGSGVGMAGIQIAKLFGATVITTASKKEKLEKALELGADHLINYQEQDFVKEVKRITNKKGVDLVFEHIGGETFEKSVLCLKRNGRLVTCGSTASPYAKIPLSHLFYKHLTFFGSYMGSKSELFEVMKFFQQKKLISIVDRTFELKNAKEAHKVIESRKQFGKVVLVN